MIYHALGPITYLESANSVAVKWASATGSDIPVLRPRN
jgi:hypothetical protein